MVAQRFASFGESVFAKFTRLAVQHGAVNLSQGFPDFDGPQLAKDAAIAAINAGHAQYAPMIGVPPLTKAIAESYAARGFDVGLGKGQIDAAQHVTVTCGCSEALPATLMGLLNPGDEIVLFEPYFDFYIAATVMSGATPRFVALHAPTKPGEPFTFDERQLRAAFTSKTKAILLNSPHNPTGKVYTRRELELIASLCVQHNVVCISDEVYEHLTYDAALPHIPIANLPGMAERTITLSSLGKTFSLTGWKVGWAVAPAPLSACVRAAHQFITFSGPTPLQHGAAAIIHDMTHPKDGHGAMSFVQQLEKLYASNRDQLATALARVGLMPHRSDSTYFLMADHSVVSKRLGLDSDVAFCEHLTREIGVAAIPPTVFYDSKSLGRPLVRFAYCKKEATMAEAIARLAGLGE
jgi:aspartate/methionine/tyrosine aminotransferase